MRFYSYMGSRNGISRGLQALQSSQADPTELVKTQAYLDTARANIDRDAAETDLTRNQLSAREGLAGALSGISLPPGMTPQSYAGIVNAATTSNPNQIMQGLTTAREDSVLADALKAVDAGDSSRANALNTLRKPGATYSPFSANDSGVLNTTTGDITGHDVSRARVGLIGAQEGAANAAAGASNALAKQRGLLEVSPGASVYDLSSALPQAPARPALPAGPWSPAVLDAVSSGQSGYSAPPSPAAPAFTAPLTPSQSGAGGAGGAGGKPTADMRRYQELLARGVPEPIALGVSNRTLKVVTGEAGISRGLVDILTGKTIGTFDSDGQFVLTPDGAQAYGRGGQAPGFIPVEQRQKGQVYDTPRGKMQWMGNGWQPVQ